MIDVLKQKLNINKSKSKIVIINILNYFKEKRLLILISKVKILIFAIKVVNITIINADTYCITCKLKRAQIFIIFIKN